MSVNCMTVCLDYVHVPKIKNRLFREINDKDDLCLTETNQKGMVLVVLGLLVLSAVELVHLLLTDVFVYFDLGSQRELWLATGLSSTRLHSLTWL